MVRIFQSNKNSMHLFLSLCNLTHCDWLRFILCRWNKKCRARVYTVGDVVTPLQKFHTHEEIIHRKKRVAKKRQADDKDYSDVDYLLLQTDKKETSEDEDAIYCVNYDN